MQFIIYFGIFIIFLDSSERASYHPYDKIQLQVYYEFYVPIYFWSGGNIRNQSSTIWRALSRIIDLYDM